MSPDLTRPVWRKSSRSNDNGGCVEVAGVGPHIAVRDSKDPLGPVLAFTEVEWNEFIASVHAGEFDLA